MAKTGDVDYDRLLLIDNNRLDRHLMEQADLFNRVAQNYTLACSVRDKLYDDIKATHSRLSNECREEAEEESRKMTDKAVETYVLDHQDYRDAVQAHLKQKRVADEWGALKESYHQRSYMLRELVQLYVAGYYMDNAVHGNVDKAKEHRAAMNKEAANQTRRRLRERREER